MNIGDRIGDYEIVQALGGVGQVYKVQDTHSGRIEAMKVLRPDLAGDPGLADRSLNEIKAQTNLDHPNIAKLRAAVRTGDQLAIVMEFVDGTTLSQVLQGGPLPPSTAVAWAEEVLDALGYAHARGLIHGDIQPANIMLTSGGQIKLVNFGIARVEANRDLAQASNYMSPEQSKGGAPDTRSDLYSLGVTMYEMVTGRPPTSPIEVSPGIPGALSDIILMAIEKDPAARFQSAEAFRAALASVFPAAVMPTRTTTPVVAAPPAIVIPPPPRAAAPWVIQPAPARSRRGLYMALGSVLTLAVLLAAVIEGPKLMRGGAADAQGVSASAAVTAVPTPVAPTPAPAQTAVPVPVAAPAVAPVPEAVSASPATPAPASLLSTRPIQQPVPAQYAFRPAQPPVLTAQAAPPVQPAASPAPPPVTATTASPEFKELRDRINRIAIRAAAAQAGVRSIEQGVQAQGLGLRGDVKAASIRLDYVLQEARASLHNGDVEGARNNLQYAEGTLQKLDKFLGQ